MGSISDDDFLDILLDEAEETQGTGRRSSILNIANDVKKKADFKASPDDRGIFTGGRSTNTFIPDPNGFRFSDIIRPKTSRLISEAFPPSRRPTGIVPRRDTTTIGERIAQGKALLMDRARQLQFEKLTPSTAPELFTFEEGGTRGELPLKNPQRALQNNPLTNYIDVSYHIGLTMLSEAGARRYQANQGTERIVDLDELRAEIRTDNSVTMASTGEEFRNLFVNEDEADRNRFRSDVIDERSRGGDAIGTGEFDLGPDIIGDIKSRNYYMIDSLNLSNVMEPSQSNPLVSTMMSMKMKITEPMGFKLHEDIREVASNLGYRNINPGRILYRVDIFFSGYNQDSGEWVYQIPLGDRDDIPSVISYVVAISRIEATTSHTGTTYDVDLVPSGHFAYRPEDTILDASTVFTGKSDTFGEFLNNLGEALNNERSKNTSGIINRKYEFYAPSIIRNASFKDRNFGLEKNYLEQSHEDGHLVTKGRDMDIFTILQASLSDLEETQRLFVRDQGNDAFLLPRIHFALRFNAIYGTPDGSPGVNKALGDYNEITYQYIFEPYITFKKGTVTTKSASTYVSPQNQSLRVREILRYGMLNRVYEYFYTGENTEVLDFDVKFNTFYYEALNTANHDTPELTGALSGKPAGSISLNRAGLDQNTRGRILITLQNDGSEEVVEESVQRLFGNSADEAQSLDLTTTDILGGGFNTSPDGSYYSSHGSNGSERRAAYETYFDDYLKNDLLTLENFRIKGDPVWLLSPYGNLSLDIMEPEKVTRSVEIRPRVGKIIFLRMFAPEQTDAMDPNRPTPKQRPNVIGGFYQVTTVDSSFEGGTFTQTLQGVKLNHLNYVESALLGNDSE